MNYRLLTTALLAALMISAGCGEEKTPGPADQADDQTAQALRTLIESNVQAQQAKDIATTMQNFHPDSTLQQQRARMEQIDRLFDVTIEPAWDQMHFYGSDGTYATLRLPQKTTAVERRTGQSRTIESDIIHIFKKHDGQWKYFHSATVDVKIPGQTSTQPTAPSTFLIEPAPAAGG
jgi:ketosteroid isomerase-like protein